MKCVRTVKTMMNETLELDLISFFASWFNCGPFVVTNIQCVKSLNKLSKIIIFYFLQIRTIYLDQLRLASTKIIPNTTRIRILRVLPGVSLLPPCIIESATLQLVEFLCTAKYFIVNIGTLLFCKYTHKYLKHSLSFTFTAPVQKSQTILDCNFSFVKDGLNIINLSLY